MTLIFDLRTERAIRQFSDYVAEVNELPDLSNADLFAYLRKAYGHPNPWSFSVEVVQAIAPASVRLRLSAAQTAALSSGSYVWDLVAERSGLVTRLAEGRAIVSPGVTDQNVIPLPPPDGSSGGAQLSDSLEAAINLSALRVVSLESTSRLVYASSDQPSQIYSTLGITREAIPQGESGRVLIEGPIADSSWSWLLGLPIFLGLNGALTQTPPTAGFLLKVARPLSPTQIYVELEQPILL